MINRVSGWVFIFLMAIACQDEDGIIFEGLQLRTSTNIDEGTKGTRDLNDWGGDETLSKGVLNLLGQTPEQDLTGTDYADISVYGHFPNPVDNSFTLMLSVDGGPCVMRCIIVNEKMKVLYSGSYVGNNKTLDFDVSDRSKFPSMSVVRMYYSFSSTGNPNFYAGHGDILICNPLSQDCF